MTNDTEIVSALERLDAICKRIANQRQADDPDTIIEYQVGRGYELGFHGATIKHQPAAWVSTGWIHCSIVWHWEDGLLEVKFTYEDPQPGDITVMTLRGAYYPEGDFQVAEAINDQL